MKNKRVLTLKRAKTADEKVMTDDAPKIIVKSYIKILFLIFFVFGSTATFLFFSFLSIVNKESLFIIFFGAFVFLGIISLIFCLRILLDRQEGLVLNDAGLKYHGLFIPWKDIVGFSIFENSNLFFLLGLEKSLVILLHDPKKYLCAHTDGLFFNRSNYIINKINYVTYGSPVVISSTIKISFDKMASDIKSYYKKYEKACREKAHLSLEQNDPIEP